MNVLFPAVLSTVLLVSSLGPQANKDKPPVPEPPPQLHITDIEQLRVEGRMKDLAIWQAQFQLLLIKIKSDHGWGDDVIWDQNKNSFVRLPAQPKR